MKKFTFALLASTLAVGVALAGGSAYAADLAPAHVGVVQAPAPAAMGGLYVSVFGGAAFANDPSGIYDTYYSFDLPLQTGYVVGGAIGAQIQPNLRGELEVSYAHHGVSTNSVTIDEDTGETGSGSFNALYILGNLWYDFNIGSPITPYIGGGAGLAVVMPDVTYYDDASYYHNQTAWAPAAQLGAGIKYSIADNITLDLGYRAKAIFNATLSGGSNSSADDATKVFAIDQTVQAGLTFGF